MTTNKAVKVKLERGGASLANSYKIASINGAITLDVFAGRGVPTKDKSTKRVGDFINEAEANLLAADRRHYDVTVVANPKAR
jgi:hypothetical protein